MTTTNAIDAIYGRAASLGRDVFHYIVTGTLFAVVCSVPWWPRIQWNCISPIFEDAGLQTAFLFIAVIVLFSAGQVLLAIGFCLQRAWMCVFCCCRHVEDYNEVSSDVEERSREYGYKPAQALKAETYVKNAHLGLEMSVLAKQPTLHATFIERYNTLWHLRLGLAASLLSAGVFDFIVGLVWFLPVCRSDSNSAWCIGLPCCEDRPYVTNAGVVVGIVAIALGLVLMRQHLVTKTNFLARVVMAFDISEQKGQNSA